MFYETIPMKVLFVLNRVCYELKNKYGVIESPKLGIESLSSLPVFGQLKDTSD